MKQLSVAFYTLGCKVNQSESQRFAREFEQKGYRIVGFDEPAHAYIINTCTVTQMADQKSRKMIRSLRKRSPHALLAVTGCYAPAAAVLMDAGDVDLIVPNAEKDQLTERVDRQLRMRRLEDHPVKIIEESLVHSSLKGLNRTRAILKIQDGCRQFCTYCIIPHVRGAWKSLPEEEVLQQTAELAAEGYREIVLLGIHLGAYGWDRGEKDGLSRMLGKLLPLFPQVRFRLGSLEPMEATHDLLELIQRYPNLCKQLHLPLQCGQDEILKQMNRPYSTGDFRQKVMEIRQLIPDIALTTDVMVGFPGEDEEKFRQCLEFVEAMGFSRLHVFAYSQRPGTAAAKMPQQVSPQAKQERSRRMIELGEKLSRQYARQWAGRCQEVLVEEEIAPGIWAGHTDNYLEVTFVLPTEMSFQSEREENGTTDGIKGQLRTVRLTGETGCKPDSWEAELVAAK